MPCLTWRKIVFSFQLRFISRVREGCMSFYGICMQTQYYPLHWSLMCKKIVVFESHLHSRNEKGGKGQISFFGE